MIGKLTTTTNLLIKYIRFYGGARQCNICLRPVRKFFRFSEQLQGAAKDSGFQYEFRRMETLNVDNCNCPFCLSSDRERLYLLYLNRYIKGYSKQFPILDFAPSKAFINAVKRFKNVQYTSADFLRTDYDIQLDVCQMPNVENDAYEVVICSHVLEHVQYPDQALREIFRVVAPGGLAILMVPIFTEVAQTVENPEYNTDELRCRYFGQSDHVRLFSKSDFIHRIESAGFDLELIDAKAFPSKDIQRYAVAENSLLYICHKR